MHGKPTGPAVLVAIFALFCPLASQAADAWIEIKSPNFMVLSNTNDRRARDIAWQLEQIRAALLAGFPWARARLDRPVQVIAAKDEDTMKALAPQYWEQRGSIHPDSVSVAAPDRYYIALRAEVNGDSHAPSLAFLANVLGQQRQAGPALEAATKAVKLEPQDQDSRLALARALWANSRQAEAMGHARAAMSLAQTEQERARAQELIDFFGKAAPR